MINQVLEVMCIYGKIMKDIIKKKIILQILKK